MRLVVSKTGKNILDALGFTFQLTEGFSMKEIVDDVLKILERSEKIFNDMVDWHIATFQERDEKKQQLYFAIYETKRKQYYALMKKLWREYEQ